MKSSNDNDFDANDELRIRLHRPVLTTMQEGANQMIKPRTGHDHRYFNNIDASESREEMNSKNSVNTKEFQDCTENRQCVRLQTPMELTLASDSCDESRCRGNRRLRSGNQNVQPPAILVVQNRCIEPTTVNSTLMGNQWLSNAFSRFASSVLGKSNEGKVDNTNVDSNPNSRSNSKLDFNFFL